jgi:iron uptake system component EfeO
LVTVAVTAGLATVAGCSSGGSSGAVAPPGPAATSAPAATASAIPADLTAGVRAYRAYVIDQAAKLQVDGRRFTDAVRSGDMAAAKEQFAPSRYRWEGIEPIAVLVSRFDLALDSRVDDHASATDPEWTGWHKIEYLMWAKNTMTGTRPLADKIDRDLATLAQEVRKVTITPAEAIKGASDLVAEVSESKITGEEDRYSHTDLSDFAANVAGAKAAYASFRGVLVDREPQLASSVDTAFTAVERSLTPYRDGSGYKLYGALKPNDKLTMQAHLSTLSEGLAMVPAALAS